MTDTTPDLRMSSIFARRPAARWLTLVALVTACGSTPAADAETPAHATSRDAARPSLSQEDATTSADVPNGTGDAAHERPRPADAATQHPQDARLDAGSPPPDASFSDGSSSDSGASSATSTAADAPGVVGKHGPLHVQGNRIVGRDGQPVQLRGMSLFWSQWSDFYLAKNVDVMVDDWKVTVLRAALGVENDGGYLQAPEAGVAKVQTIVERAIARGIYVIIDWHDHHAQDHAAQATRFFQDMAKLYGQQPHVIFEIYNEPVDVSWSVVKSYAEPMIAAIRAAGSKNLIVVGTPNWSQDVDIAASDRITSDDNVAYTLHFYAATHKQPLRDKAQAALDRGIALFVTEWGTCSADGNGSVDQTESQTWLTFLQGRSLSWANWALNNKAEACSAIVPSGASSGPWRDEQLTASGLWVKRAIP